MPVLGRREKAKQAVYQRIQDAARRLVAERGLANVTIDEIADAADVSRRTFTNYFDSKEAAVVDAPYGTTQLLAAMLAARPEGESLWNGLREVSCALVAGLAPALQQLVPLMRDNPRLAHRHTAAFAPMHAAIVAWVVDRTGDDPATDLSPELIADVGGQIIQKVVQKWQPDAGTDAMLNLVNDIIDRTARGLATPERRTRRRTRRPADLHQTGPSSTHARDLTGLAESCGPRRP